MTTQPITIKPVSDKDSWNTWLLQQNPNTFLQSWEWGQTQQSDGEKVAHLGIFKNDLQIGAALTITVNAKRGKHLLVPHGPILLSSPTESANLSDILNALVKHLKAEAKNEQATAIKIAPLLEDDTSNQQLFHDLGFRPAPLHVHSEETWVLDITPDDDSLLQGMRKTTRHAVRKAEREGVSVEITTDLSAIDRFWPLYDTTRSRHDFAPFPKSFLESQFQHFSADNRAYFAIARYNNEDVVAAMFIHFGNTVFYHHGASKWLPSKIPAAQLLQWHSILEAKRRGASRYNFWGIAPKNKPDHPFQGITTFKKGFGGQEIDYLHAQDLPLSPKYYLMWAIDKYRAKKRGF